MRRWEKPRPTPLVAPDGTCIPLPEPPTLNQVAARNGFLRAVSAVAPHVPETLAASVYPAFEAAAASGGLTAASLVDDPEAAPDAAARLAACLRLLLVRTPEADPPPWLAYEFAETLDSWARPDVDEQTGRRFGDLLREARQWAGCAYGYFPDPERTLPWELELCDTPPHEGWCSDYCDVVPRADTEYLRRTPPEGHQETIRPARDRWRPRGRLAKALEAERARRRSLGWTLSAETRTTRKSTSIWPLFVRYVSDPTVSLFRIAVEAKDEIDPTHLKRRLHAAATRLPFPPPS